MLDAATQEAGSGIIYVGTRKDAVAYASELDGGLPDEETLAAVSAAVVAPTTRGRAGP